MTRDNCSALARGEKAHRSAEFVLRIASLRRKRVFHPQLAQTNRRMRNPLRDKGLHVDAQNAQTCANRSPHEAQNAAPYIRAAFAAVTVCVKQKPLQIPYQLQLERTTTIRFVAGCGRALLAQPDGDHSHAE